MNIWLISLFDPVPIDEPIYPRFIEIAKAANRAGNSVTHFTSTFRHTTKSYRFSERKYLDIDDQYKVVLIHSKSYKRNMEPKRFVAHLDFANKLIKEFDNHKQPDVVFMSMPPLSTADLVSKWCNTHKVPLVLDIIDPWPDSFIKDVPDSLKPAAKLLLFSFYRKTQKFFERASGVTAISKGYLDWAEKFIPIQTPRKAFFLAIDFEAIQKSIAEVKQEPGDSKPLRIIYAGSLSSSYDIPGIIGAAEILEKEHYGKVEFIITGKGSQVGLIENVKEKLSNIHYLGFVTREELIKQYALADLGLIQHKNNLTQTITYKFFNYLSAGLPVLNSLQSEMADMIDNYDLGLNNDAQDSQQLASNIIRYLDDPTFLKRQKNNALNFTEEFGDVKAVYGKLIDFLVKIKSESGLKKVKHV